MPEGHTIHRLAAEQQRDLGGQVIAVCSPQRRFKAEATDLDRRRLRLVEAVGKHLFYHFVGGRVMHVHLGLYGKFTTQANPPAPPRGAVRVRLTGRAITVDLNGPNRCEVIDRSNYQQILDRLGPDPLNAKADWKIAWRRIHSSRAPIGLLLMDQSVMAGIGNIYRCELLHLIKIHPRMPGNKVSQADFKRLWMLARKLMKLGVKHGRIVTIDPKQIKTVIAKTARGKLLRIYKKAKCPDCGSPIERFVMGGRNVFACGHCQRSTVPIPEKISTKRA